MYLYRCAGYRADAEGEESSQKWDGRGVVESVLTSQPRSSCHGRINHRAARVEIRNITMNSAAEAKGEAADWRS